MAKKKKSILNPKLIFDTFYEVTFTTKLPRIPRSYYWIYQIFILLIEYVSFFLGYLGMEHTNVRSYFIGVILIAIALILFFVAVLANIETKIARLHDSNHSGWNIFWAILPYVGGLIVLIMCGFIGSTPGRNSYGKPLSA